MKLATIERILQLDPIAGADKIVLAKILGWDVVVKKEEFKVGDWCVYIPIDTQVDPTRECFKFLASPKNPTQFMRIRTTRLRGVWSQGLALPISCLGLQLNEEQLAESTDVSELLGVTKYEKENIFSSDVTTSNCEKFPIHYINKTDEDNLKTKYMTLKEFVGQQVYITQKIDGSSMTLIWNKDRDNFLVCSRNLVLDTGMGMFKYVNHIGLKERIVKYGKNLAIQGEFSGPKINGNAMGLKDYEFYVFTIKDLDTGLFYGLDGIKKITNDLELQMVPVIGIYDIDNTWSIDKFQSIANAQEYIQSNGKKVPGEGIVVRPVKPIYSQTLCKMLSVKIINQHYKD